MAADGRVYHCRGGSPSVLSIVVPAYNEQRVIGRFIDSVRSELSSGAFNWEAVLVDDGSADDTVRIVRSGETWRRRVSGRVFNAVVRLFAVRGIGELYVARRTGFRIREVGIVCHCRHDSRVRVKAGIMSFVDVLRVRLKTRRPNPVVREAASSSTSHR